MKDEDAKSDLAKLGPDPLVPEDDAQTCIMDVEQEKSSAMIPFPLMMVVESGQSLIGTGFYLLMMIQSLEIDDDQNTDGPSEQNITTTESSSAVDIVIKSAGTGRFYFYAIVLVIHIMIRSLMDLKYDTSMYTGKEKFLQFLRLVLINLLQLRRPMDCYLSVPTGVPTMSLTLTRTADALVKNTMTAILVAVTFFDEIWLEEPQSGFIDIFQYNIVPVGLLLLSIYGTAETMTEFEESVNPKATKGDKRTLSYLFLDATLRPVLLGYVIHMSIGRFGWAAFGVILGAIYFNRIVLFIWLFAHRGYVYPPKKGEKLPQGTMHWLNVLGFSAFPAGFIQALTDFPFNGEFSSGRTLYSCFQGVSFTENVILFVCSEIFLLDQKETVLVRPDMSESVWVVRIILGCLLLFKASLLPYYFSIKAPEPKSSGSVAPASTKGSNAQKGEPNKKHQSERIAQVHQAEIIGRTMSSTNLLDKSKQNTEDTLVEVITA